MQPPLVLVVEDHDDTRDLFAEVFRVAGFAVLTAESGATALARVATGPLPAIVITDLKMSGAVSAAQLCRTFGARGVPVIAVTGVSPGAHHEEMRAAGCAAILFKPVEVDQLVDEVRRILADSPRLNDESTVSGRYKRAPKAQAKGPERKALDFDAPDPEEPF